jgi:hypothetical protein
MIYDPFKFANLNNQFINIPMHNNDIKTYYRSQQNATGLLPLLIWLAGGLFIF